VVLTLLLACTPEPDPAVILTRASLDLRGVRPSAEDLDWVATDPATLDAFLEAYLQDSRFGDRVASQFSAIYQTRAIESDHADAEYGLEDEVAFAAALGEEPLRLLALIAREDRPYTDLVTGDTTVINEVLAEFYPTDYPAGATGWQEVHHTDGRPVAGVLSTSGFYWRYQTTTSNANRGRANAVSRILLCNDYLQRDIAFDTSVSLVDEAAVQDAVKENPSCAACHVSLDPLAGVFWGFTAFNSWSPDELSNYHPDREREWESTTAVTPAYYGSPIRTVTELGRAVAEDERFVSCVVEQAWSRMVQREPGVGDQDELLRHREAFLAGGTTLRSLYRSILASESWRATPAEAPIDVPWKLLDADQLGSAVEALTGYRFVVDGHDVLATDLYGTRSLLGGVSVGNATDAATVATPALVLYQERLAQAAGAWVAGADAADPAGARLLRGVDFEATPTTHPDQMAEVMQGLLLAVLSKRVPADDPEVTALLALWSEVHALEGDPVSAWAAVITVLLRRPEFLVY